MLAFSLFLTFLLPAFAQDVSTPSSWNTTTYLSQSERTTLADNAAARLVSQIDPATGRIDALGFSSQDVNLAAVLALQDLHSGQKAHQATLTTIFSAYYSTHNNSFFAAHGNNEDIQWGLSAYYAYRAYSDQAFYNIAKAAWQRVSAYFVDAQAANAGKQSTRSVSFLSSCLLSQSSTSNATNAGAVFMFTNTTNDTTTNAQTLGPFMALGAYLYEVDQSVSQYLDYANLTGYYINQHLFNGSIVLDTANVATCGLDRLTALTYNTGYAIEAVAVLANQSAINSGNGLTFYKDWLDVMVPQAIKFSGWTGSDGVIFEENADPDNWTSGLKAVLIRGLLEARARNPTADWAPLVDNFITVQYNALLASAVATNDSTYSTNWHTVSNGTLSNPGSITALDVLNAAIVTPTNDTPSPSGSNSSSGSTPQPSSPSKHSSNAGAIAGGVIGGLAALAIVIGVLFWLRRRRRRTPSSQAFLNPDGSTNRLAIEPFVADKQSPVAETPNVYEMAPSTATGDYMQSKMQRMQLSYAPQSESRSGATPGASVAPSSTNPPSSAASQPIDDSLSPHEVSVLMRRLNNMLNRGPASPTSAAHDETDAYHGAPPPGYQDAAGL